MEDKQVSYQIHVYDKNSSFQLIYPALGYLSPFLSQTGLACLEPPLTLYAQLQVNCPPFGSGGGERSILSANDSGSAEDWLFRTPCCVWAWPGLALPLVVGQRNRFLSHSASILVLGFVSELRVGYNVLPAYFDMSLLNNSLCFQQQQQSVMPASACWWFGWLTKMQVGMWREQMKEIFSPCAKGQPNRADARCAALYPWFSVLVFIRNICSCHGDFILANWNGNSTNYENDRTTTMSLLIFWLMAFILSFICLMINNS